MSSQVSSASSLAPYTHSAAYLPTALSIPLSTRALAQSLQLTFYSHQDGSNKPSYRCPSAPNLLTKEFVTIHASMIVLHTARDCLATSSRDNTRCLPGPQCHGLALYFRSRELAFRCIAEAVAGIGSCKKQTPPTSAQRSNQHEDDKGVGLRTRATEKVFIKIPALPLLSCASQLSNIYLLPIGVDSVVDLRTSHSGCMKCVLAAAKLRHRSGHV